MPLTSQEEFIRALKDPSFEVQIDALAEPEVNARTEYVAVSVPHRTVVKINAMMHKNCDRKLCTVENGAAECPRRAGRALPEWRQPSSLQAASARNKSAPRLINTQASYTGNSLYVSFNNGVGGNQQRVVAAPRGPAPRSIASNPIVEINQASQMKRVQDIARQLGTASPGYADKKRSAQLIAT